MFPALTVSQFVELINTAFDSLGDITVQGEVSDYKVVHNKWVTFSLKDEESTLPCFMTIWQLNTQIEDGMLVRISGQPRLRNKGFFSFVVQQVTPAGEGALKRAFELLQQKLATEGLFASERKRSLPRFPQHIALITSREAAAYSDFIKVLQGRIGGLQISFIHTQVQGQDAPQQIIEALSTANTQLENVDVIVLVRGGGSLEDLQAFNDETVVRAVAASRTPIIVGVGHERDITLAELAADVRASTPSNAAELLVLSRQEIIQSLASFRDRLSLAIRNTQQEYEQVVARSMHILRNRLLTTRGYLDKTISSLDVWGKHLRSAIEQRSQMLSHIQHQILLQMKSTVTIQSQSLTQLQRYMRSLSPEQTLHRGYSITRIKNGKVVKTAADITSGDIVETTLSQGSFTSTVQ